MSKMPLGVKNSLGMTQTQKNRAQKARARARKRKYKAAFSRGYGKHTFGSLCEAARL